MRRSTRFPLTPYGEKLLREAAGRESWAEAEKSGHVPGGSLPLSDYSGEEPEPSPLAADLIASSSASRRSGPLPAQPSPASEAVWRDPNSLATLEEVFKLLNNRILGSGGNPSENLQLRNQCIAACERFDDLIRALKRSGAKKDDGE